MESASGVTNFQGLKTYGRDLVEQAGKLDPVIGRDEEIRRIVGILSHRTKNNPVHSLASTVWARRPSWRASRNASCAAMCLATSSMPPHRARHGPARRRRQVPRRVRGAAQGRAEGDGGGSGEGHSLHRRDTPRPRRGRDGGLHGRGQPVQADAGEGPALVHRRHHVGGVQQVRGDGRSSVRAMVPAGVHRRAEHRRHDQHSEGTQGKVRGAPWCEDSGPRPRRRRQLSSRYIMGRHLPDKALGGRGLHQCEGAARQPAGGDR
ncbi:hypothetical protein BS78_K046500 [Paspalum vaginatum]|uniref:Uncharacterized protein n=1 Tax=Paspalum vaginatum TaxID=158149 RepID=A0A9W7XAB6_9POAL|nr:hypothetical protein BS78_K046500 [Paspalum vaginatum]